MKLTRVSTALLTIAIAGTGCTKPSPPEAATPVDEGREADRPDAKLSEADVAMYAAAFRIALSTDSNRVVFLRMEDGDPPPELVGLIFRPQSRAHLKFDPEINDERIVDKQTGERGTILTVKIIERANPTTVRVECTYYSDRSGGGGYEFVMRLKDGEWILEEIDLESEWVS